MEAGPLLEPGFEQTVQFIKKNTKDFTAYVSQ